MGKFWKRLAKRIMELGGERYVVRRCSICGDSHHDKRTCPNRAKTPLLDPSLPHAFTGDPDGTCTTCEEPGIFSTKHADTRKEANEQSEP